MEILAFARTVESQFDREIDRAKAFVWYLTEKQSHEYAKIEDIVGFFRQGRISEPNKSRLQERMLRSGDYVGDRSKGRFILKNQSLSQMDSCFGHLFDSAKLKVISNAAKTLREHANEIKSDASRAYISEAISCLENGTLKSAIIMAWVGAVAVLQEYVFYNKLTEFNKDMRVNSIIRKDIDHIDQIRDCCKDSQLLDSIKRMGLIDDGIKKSLTECLSRRNSFGHPSAREARENSAAAHIEELISHVFKKF